VQDVADANGFILEDMLLHASIDMKYSTSSVAKWWKDMQQFDAFEKSASSGASIRGVFTYNGTYTDVTAASYDNAHQITVANTLFVGYMEPFDQMNFTISRARVGGSASYYYWNGSAWAPLVPRSDTTSGLTATGAINFYPPANWMRTVVNGSKSKYWVRIVVTNAITTPVYSRLYGDDWNIASGANNARGWNPTAPACPSNTPNGTSCRINVGTRLEYNANPPTDSSAKFRYQARTTGIWAANATFGNPSNIQKGVRTWARYLTDVTAAQVIAKGTEGIMFDDGSACPNPVAPVDQDPYLDIDHSQTCEQHRLTTYGQVRDALHALFGPNFQVGTNTMSASLGQVGDWAYAESYAYTSYSLGGRYTIADDESRYDWWLPANNPRGTKTAILCWDTPGGALNPGSGQATKWHFWDRGNRSPLACLAQHYIGSNENTAFAYYTEGGFIYNDTDEVYTYAPATTILTPVATDTTSQSKTIQLASTSGCTNLLRIGSRDNGDTVSGSFNGNVFTTTGAIYHAYSAGDPAYCIQKQHQSIVSPPVENVWKWSTWFPARGVDIGAPDPAGINGGARLTYWKKGGAPDYVSGQTRATCDTSKCSDLWRRDFTKAIVLLRTMVYQTLDSEYDTPSNPIELGGTFYPLRADGTTGPGVTSIRLRGAEAAILMKRPISSAESRPPVCNPGQQMALRAGQDAQLDASGSASLNGDSALRYLWQQLSGPTAVRWSSRAVARPSISGLTFGSYLFQLTVTDSSNQSSSCTVKHGAVATDANGIVISNDAAVSSVLGPLIRAGANPWPWFDDRHKAAADLQIPAMDTVYPPWWDSPAPGTVTVAPGSQAVTGAGTSFTSTFCQGPADPTTPKNDAMMAVWYRTGNGLQTGRRMAKVVACQDDTHLTIDDPWAAASIPAGSGLGYSADDASTHHATDWGWADAAAPGNAGDNVAAYYALYYRTGIDDYLDAARKLADRVWRSPMVDRGAGQSVSYGGQYGYAGHSLGIVGLLLRALELQGTEDDMWPGMRTIWDSYMDRLIGVDKSRAPGMWHTEEQAHHLTIVSYCALFDPDPAYRANCKAAASNSFANVWTPSLLQHGYWAQLYYTKSSWDSASSASLVHGSGAVVGNGTSWAAADFPATIWFTNDPAAKPATNQAGDASVYTVTFVNSGLLLLDRPYEGSTGVHGWAATPGEAMLGWGARPSDVGTLASAFGLAARAIAGTYSTDAALAAEYSASAVDWIRDYGYWPARKGLYAYVQGINCHPPISDANTACTSDSGTPEARARNSEALKGLMPVYAARQDTALRDLGDILFNAMFARPDSCPSGSALCIPDAGYLSGLDQGGSMLTDLPPDGNRWFGEFFGFNNLSAWPAARMGRLPTANRRAKYVAFNLGQVQGAVGVRVKATSPNGEQTTVECSSSPCPVTVDIRQGRSLIEMQYLSGTGKTLATTASPL
jgi:hypothetical protein